MSDSDECPDCGFVLDDDLSGTLVRTPRSREFPCDPCLWAHGPVLKEARDARAEIANLRLRVGFTVVGIDAGRFREPSDAVDEILATLASIYPPHREELLAWIETLPEVQS